MLRKMGLIAGILTIAIAAQASGKRAIVVYKTPSRAGMATEGIASLNLTAMAHNLQQNQIEVLSTLRGINSLVINIENDQELERLRKDPAVALVELDRFIPGPKPVNGFIAMNNRIQSRYGALAAKGRPWGIDAVKAPQAWGVSRSGQGSRVLILDTGVDRDHPMLKDNYEGGANLLSLDPEVNSELSSNSYPEMDDIGHGTHVAGTIAAKLDSSGFSGVAPKAKFLAGKVCGHLGCSTVSIAAGINWGVEEKVDVISMSLGGAISPPSVRLAVMKAESAGVVVVAASGNDGVGKVSYPAALPTVIAVGASGPDNMRASFSQYGPELDIMAPGVSVDSTLPLGSGRDSVVTVGTGNQAREVANAPVQGTGDFTGTIDGDLVYAGLGKPEDFVGKDLKGKVALIARGEIPFLDKVVNSVKAGAVAALIYNNEPGIVRGGIQSPTPINMPVFIIEQKVGLDIKKVLEAGKTVSAEMKIEATDYGALDGTSMATPHVSGVVALIRATNKNLTPAEIREIIKNSAEKMNFSTDAQEVGAGLIDAAAAVSAAKLAR